MGKINVEAEKNELILENEFGDKVIIPAKKRQWVQKQIEKGNHADLDNYISTLPIKSDFAEEGSVVPGDPTKKVKVYTGKPEYFVQGVAPRNGERKNEDGSVSTHLMSYTSADDVHYAYPTLFQDGDKWIQLDDKDDWAAFKEAQKRKELFKFDNEEDAKKFAEGSWKTENIKEYDIDSPEYRELYNSGAIANYDKNSDTYILSKPLEEVTVTAEAPQWMKYKRDYEKNNPKSDYINQYLTPFARSLGNTETNYPKRLDDEYEQKTNQYIVQQVFKNNPIKSDESRGQYLDRLVTKEYTQDVLDENGNIIHKKGDKFRVEQLDNLLHSNLNENDNTRDNVWRNSYRGLKSLIEINPVQTFQRILSDESMSWKEKSELLKDYSSSPILSKIKETLGIIEPLSIPYNATIGNLYTQQEGEKDYNWKKALSGNVPKNQDALLSITTDPLNFFSVGLVGKLSKADKVINATKAGSKVLNKTDDVVKNLPKLEQIPLDFKIEDVLKNISSTERKNMEIIKKGNAYFRELDNPESLKRLKEFGDEYGIDLLDAYKKAEQRWDYGKNIGGHSKFKVKKTDESWYGLSTTDMDYKDQIRIFDLENKFGKDSKQVKDFYKQLSQEKSINYISDVVPLDRYEKTIWHELSHDINKSIIDSSPKLQEDIKNIFIEKGTADLDKVKKGREYVAKDFYTKKDEVLKDLDNPEKIKKIAEDEFDYVTRPTETWAFLSTNLRQDLKNTGVIKNYNEILTPEKLEQAIKNGNTVFSRFEPYIKDKDAFIKLFNKMTLSIAPAALYLQSQNKNKSEQ